MFLGFPDPDPHPDPLVRDMDPDPSISRKPFFFNLFFVGILKLNDENSRIRMKDPDPLVRGMDPDSDPNQNVKDPEHWLNQRQILQCILLIYIDHKLLGCIYLSDRLCLEFEVLTASSYALFC
jgi:hypothetical protein